MPQLHGASQMRQQVIQQACIGLFEGGFPVGAVQANRHEPGSPQRHHRADHMAQADMPPEISVEFTSDVLGIRH
jgi:hypothetical protein